MIRDASWKTVITGRRIEAPGKVLDICAVRTWILSFLILQFISILIYWQAFLTVFFIQGKNEMKDRKIIINPVFICVIFPRNTFLNSPEELIQLSELCKRSFNRFSGFIHNETHKFSLKYCEWKFDILAPTVNRTVNLHLFRSVSSQ